MDLGQDYVRLCYCSIFYNQDLVGMLCFYFQKFMDIVSYGCGVQQRDCYSLLQTYLRGSSVVVFFVFHPLRISFSITTVFTLFSRYLCLEI